jgi:hypothetical protein
LILIAAGAWFLLQAVGIPLPGMDRLWPIFPTLVGVAFFVGWLFSPDKKANHGVAIPGTICLLVGLFFFGFTFDFFKWGDMAYLWPVFPLIVGIAFVVAWILSLFSEWGLLIPAAITGTVGLVGLAFTLNQADNAFLNWVVKGWPAILILIGLVVLLGTLFGRGERRAPPSVEGLEGYTPPPAGEETVTQEYKHESDL